MRWVRVARGLSWTACEKQDRVTYPCLLTSSDSVLSNTPSSSWHPLFFFCISLSFFYLFSSPSCVPLLSSSSAPLVSLSNHYCLCLLPLRLSGVSLLAQFNHPTDFMSLIPFLTMCLQVWGQVLICLSLFLPLSLMTHRICFPFSITPTPIFIINLHITVLHLFLSCTTFHLSILVSFSSQPSVPSFLSYLYASSSFPHLLCYTCLSY